jgi:hypothetical protein
MNDEYKEEPHAAFKKRLADNGAKCEEMAKAYAARLASGELKRPERKRDDYNEPVQFGSYPGMRAGDAWGE